MNVHLQPPQMVMDPPGIHEMPLEPLVEHQLLVPPPHPDGLVPPPGFVGPPGTQGWANDEFVGKKYTKMNHILYTVPSFLLLENRGLQGLPPPGIPPQGLPPQGLPPQPLPPQGLPPQALQSPGSQPGMNEKQLPSLLSLKVDPPEQLMEGNGTTDVVLPQVLEQVLALKNQRALELGTDETGGDNSAPVSANEVEKDGTVPLWERDENVVSTLVIC